jgi:hypothetical protein
MDFSIVNNRINCQFSKNKTQLSVDDFVAQNITEQRNSVLQMPESQLKAFFTKLASYVRDANDAGSSRSATQAFLVVSAKLARGVEAPQSQDVRVSRVLGVMYDKVKYCGEVENSKGRDACAWTGALVLAEGNFNGCVEAAVLFKALYDELSAQLDASFPKATYVSSFDLTQASQENTAGQPYSGAGHAVIAIGASYYDVTNFTQTNDPDAIKLTVTQDTYAKKVNYNDGQGEGVHTFRLFSPGKIYTTEKAPGGSTEATLEAINKYFTPNLTR